MKHTAQRYVQEWINKTGRAPSDVYVPEALRLKPVEGNRVNVKDLPGYADFTARLLEVHPAIDDRGRLAAVIDDEGHVVIAPLSTITKG